MKPIKTQGNFMVIRAKGFARERVAGFALESDKVLFEAAPGLLEALRIITLVYREDGEYDKHDMAGVVRIAERAITKAEGRG